MALEVLNNYPIVYWKVLPVVYYATFMCTSVWQEKINLREGSKWFNDWWLISTLMVQTALRTSRIGLPRRFFENSSVEL